MTAERWLVAGLGNPPQEYAGTRHNVGAEAVEDLGAAHATTLARNRRAGSRTAEVRIDGDPVVLAVPEGYMNVSGTPVARTVAWYRIPPDRLIVCHDDLDLPLGSLRCKRGGGHAGHNGLRDIDRALGTTDYLRVRIGVGRPPGSTVAADHVLRPFGADERATVATVRAEVGAVVASLVSDGLEATQNRWHGWNAAGPDMERS